MARVVALDLDRPELCPNEQARVKGIISPPDSQVQWFVDGSEVFLSGNTLVVGGFLGVAISQGQSREITAKLENSLSKTVRKESGERRRGARPAAGQ